MRAILVAMAILALSSCATAPRSNSNKAEENVDPTTVGLLHIPVRANGLVGTLVVPDTTQVYPGVLRLGGAEGGVRTSDAESIASEGYAVLALAYFGVGGFPLTWKRFLWSISARPLHGCRAVRVSTRSTWES